MKTTSVPGHVPSTSFVAVIYDANLSSWNPHNWFTGQLTLGRFVVRVDASGPIVVRKQGRHLVGVAAIKIHYEVRDLFDPLGGRDPMKFTNFIEWTESVTVKVTK